jgi:shikimate 5-dehydrogenase
MLIFQGIAAMQIWSGRKIDAESVYPNLRKLLLEKVKH